MLSIIKASREIRLTQPEITQCGVISPYKALAQVWVLSTDYVAIQPAEENLLRRCGYKQEQKEGENEGIYGWMDSTHSVQKNQMKI